MQQNEDLIIAHISKNSKKNNISNYLMSFF